MKSSENSVYLGMRDQALHFRLANLEQNAVHAVLMDWFVGHGTATVGAFADGNASIYLSSGGGFIGGGQSNPALREGAIEAVRIANSLKSVFQPAEELALPTPGEVFFYLTTSAGISVAKAIEEKMRAGTDALLPLGNAMQWIVTNYRMSYSQRPPS